MLLLVCVNGNLGNCILVALKWYGEDKREALYRISYSFPPVLEYKLSFSFGLETFTQRLMQKFSEIKWFPLAVKAMEFIPSI